MPTLWVHGQQKPARRLGKALCSASAGNLARGGGAMTDTRHFPEELPYDLPNELKQIAQEALYEHLQRPSPPTDKHEYEADSRQVAWLTVWIAANLYDPTRGKTLQQWVRGCVRAALHGDGASVGLFAGGGQSAFAADRGGTASVVGLVRGEGRGQKGEKSGKWGPGGL